LKKKIFSSALWHAIKGQCNNGQEGMLYINFFYLVDNGQEAEANLEVRQTAT